MALLGVFNRIFQSSNFSFSNYRCINQKKKAFTGIVFYLMWINTILLTQQLTWFNRKSFQSIYEPYIWQLRNCRMVVYNTNIYYVPLFTDDTYIIFLCLLMTHTLCFFVCWWHILYASLYIYLSVSKSCLTTFIGFFSL